MLLAVICLDRRHATTFVVAASLMALVTALGCPDAESVEENNAATDSAKAPPAVRLLVVDDAAMATAIEREWNASGRGELEIVQSAAADLAETKRLAADVVIYPASMLGDFAERHLIAELPAAAVDYAEFAQADIFPLLRRRECTWGEKVYAVPFGSPQLLLIYRKDLFEELKLTPPTTWRQYDELLTLLDKRWYDYDPLQPGAAEPLADGWGAKLLLARAAAYARHPNNYSALFDYRTMKPLIAEPPYVRALEELVAARNHSPTDKQSSPTQIEQLMLEGKKALAITYPAPKFDLDQLKPWSQARLACAELPGAQQVYNFETKQWSDTSEVSRVPLLGISGRLGSITTSARHTRSAADALLWLAGKEKGPLLAAQCPACTLSRSSQVPQASRFISEHYDADFAGQFGAALEAANQRPLSMETPRTAGHEAYLAALDAAVQASVAGEKSPAEALVEAAEQWREITKQHGVAHQRAAYMRSLGLEP